MNATLQINFPGIEEAHWRFGEACRHAGPLDSKLRELVALGIVLGVNQEEAARRQVRRALNAGATAEELWHAVVLTAPTLGFPRMLRALEVLNETLATAAATPAGNHHE